MQNGLGVKMGQEDNSEVDGCHNCTFADRFPPPGLPVWQGHREQQCRAGTGGEFLLSRVQARLMVLMVLGRIVLFGTTFAKHMSDAN
jgi:hypothetical protein